MNTQETAFKIENVKTVSMTTPSGTLTASGAPDLSIGPKPKDGKENKVSLKTKVILNKAAAARMLEEETHLHFQA